MHYFVGFLLDVLSSCGFLEVVCRVRRTRRVRPLNYFDGVVWPDVDDLRWRYDHPKLVFDKGQVTAQVVGYDTYYRDGKMVEREVPYCFGISVGGQLPLKTAESYEYCEAVRRAVMSRTVYLEVTGDRGGES